YCGYMLQSVEIGNFRSVEGPATVALGPLTVLFGPTAAGKSTLLYALSALRNFALNPNQTVDGFFNLGFQNLGGFDACVFNHELYRKITLGATSGPAAESLTNTGGTFRLLFGK